MAPKTELTPDHNVILPGVGVGVDRTGGTFEEVLWEARFQYGGTFSVACGVDFWTASRPTGAKNLEAATDKGLGRPSGGIANEIRVLLIGMDCNGTVFSQETQKVTLGRRGAGIISKHKLVTDGF